MQEVSILYFFRVCLICGYTTRLLSPNPQPCQHISQHIEYICRPVRNYRLMNFIKNAEAVQIPEV